VPTDAHPLQNPATTLERGERNEGLTEFEAPIVAAFADLVVLLGLPKSVGEIYGLLFATAGSLTFVEIEQKLELSKGSVSQGLRALRDLGAIAEAEPGAGGTGVPQARLARWVATIELRKLIGVLLRERITPYLSRQDQRAAAAGEALTSMTAGLAADQRTMLEGRLDKFQTWQSRARTVLPLIGKML
jgi:DNA-binding transcriptional ArsR family regulator